MSWSRELATEGDEPDPRWSLANERTLLAYSRTALALLVAGLALTGSRQIADAPVGLAALGIPLLVLGGAVSVGGWRRFREAQTAMRKGEALPPPALGTILPATLAIVAAGAAVAAVVELVGG